MGSEKPEVTEFKIDLEGISETLFNQLCSNGIRIQNCGPLQDGKPVGKYRWVHIYAGGQTPIIYSVDDYAEGISRTEHREHICSRVFTHEELLKL